MLFLDEHRNGDRREAGDTGAGEGVDLFGEFPRFDMSGPQPSGQEATGALWDTTVYVKLQKLR